VLRSGSSTDSLTFITTTGNLGSLKKYGPYGGGGGPLGQKQARQRAITG
jgi:hypothetical protein